MTADSVKILREFFENDNTLYTLTMDNVKYMPSNGPTNLLVYDDTNQLVYSFRPAQNPFDANQRVNVLASEYDHIQFFDCDMTQADAKKKLQKLVTEGKIEADKVKEFLDVIKANWEPVGLYNREIANPTNMKV